MPSIATAPRTRLRVLIDEDWPATPAAEWVLLDGAGSRLAHGRDRADEWPQGMPVVVLGATQSAWHVTPLPGGRAASDPRVLAYALEEALLGEPDAHHLTRLPSAADREGAGADVLATGTGRLRQILDALANAGRTPCAMYSELACVSPATDHTRLLLRPGMAILRCGHDAPVALDPDPQSLAALIEPPHSAAGTTDGVPATVDIMASDACADIVRQLRDACSDVRFADAGRYQWWRLPAAVDLLHGPFARAGNVASWRRTMRLPAAIAAAALLLLGGATLADILRLRTAIDALDADMRRQFAAALPTTPMVVPEVQLARHLASLRAQAGHLSDDDLLALLRHVAAARDTVPAAAISRLDYADRRLTLHVAADSAGDVARLGDALPAQAAARVDLQRDEQP